MPLTHATATFVMAILMNGGQIIQQDQRDPGSILAAIERHRATHLYAPPTLLYRLMDHADAAQPRAPGRHRAGPVGPRGRPARARRAGRAQIDTTTAGGCLVFGIFAALAEFERELIRERTVAGLTAARACGRKGGRKFALSKAQVRLAQAAMANRDTSVAELCRELGIVRVTLYRYVDSRGDLREHRRRVLKG